MLLSAEDTIGKLGLRVVLRKAGLDHLISNYPSYQQPKPSGRFTFGDYADLNTGLIDFCGSGAGSELQVMGRVTIKYSVMDQGALYGIGTVNLEASLQWLTGESIHVEEVECRAMGAKACIWEISKHPNNRIGTMST